MALYEPKNTLECRHPFSWLCGNGFRSCHAVQIPRIEENPLTFSTHWRTSSRASIVLHAPVTTLKSWIMAQQKGHPFESTRKLSRVSLCFKWLTIYHMQVRQFHQVMKHYNTASAVRPVICPWGENFAHPFVMVDHRIKNALWAYKRRIRATQRGIPWKSCYCSLRYAPDVKTEWVGLLDKQISAWHGYYSTPSAPCPPECP